MPRISLRLENRQFSRICRGRRRIILEQCAFFFNASYALKLDDAIARNQEMIALEIYYAYH